MFDLSARVALVTGAGQGVGAEIAAVLAGAGCAVAVNDLQPERAAATADQLTSAGATAVPLPFDVADPAAVSTAVETAAAALGPVDVLVNNAGIPPGAQWLVPFRDTDPADWDAWLRVNLYGVLNCTHATIGGMCDRGWGRVVTIVSDAARSGEALMAVYSAAKAGAAGFMRSIAKEVGRTGVTANCVALGNMGPPTGTPETAEVRAQFEALARRYPVGRVGRATDVAPAVLYLCSPEAEWVTGQTLAVNGGYITS
ncbi:MAG: SDR family oxidoreductase [Acidimicrobiia bacterium]|nr:SDR family oxidoreductase [Acidimicrobiia bacterium]